MYFVPMAWSQSPRSWSWRRRSLDLWKGFGNWNKNMPSSLSCLLFRKQERNMEEKEIRHSGFRFRIWTPLLYSSSCPAPYNLPFLHASHSTSDHNSVKAIEKKRRKTTLSHQSSDERNIHYRFQYMPSSAFGFLFWFGETEVLWCRANAAFDVEIMFWESAIGPKSQYALQTARAWAQ